MAINRSGSKLTKKIPAFVMALGMTLLIGIATLAVSANALGNRNVVPLQGSATVVQATSTDTSNALQLQDLVSQYQEREKQYQARELQYNQELQQAAQQLNDARGQIQQYQSILVALQSAGVISVDQNGQIFIPQGGFESEEHEGNDG